MLATFARVKFSAKELSISSKTHASLKRCTPTKAYNASQNAIVLGIMHARYYRCQVGVIQVTAFVRADRLIVTIFSLDCNHY